MLPKNRLILGIETSCDETSVAVVQEGRKVLSCEIASSIPLHQITQGVVPEVAAREQIKAILQVLEIALEKAKVLIQDIDLIAVTAGPGLIGSLIVGIATANMLSLATKIPVVGVPHIWGHIHANLLDQTEEIQFPALVLTVSGGHNDLYLWKKHGQFKLLGRTFDDAAGEAFDKCGRLLGLNYPAGKEVSDLALKGNKNAFKFPRAMRNSPDYNFSFSGLKTSFLYTIKKIENLDEKVKTDLAASLQEAVVESLFFKVQKALAEFEVKEIHLSGGVAANSRLREYFQSKIKDMKLRYPHKIVYCTDNAAMIASCAYFCDFKKEFVSPQLNKN